MKSGLQMPTEFQHIKQTLQKFVQKKISFEKKNLPCASIKSEPCNLADTNVILDFSGTRSIDLPMSSPNPSFFQEI
jgi:hypothetical protein